MGVKRHSNDTPSLHLTMRSFDASLASTEIFGELEDHLTKDCMGI